MHIPDGVISLPVLIGGGVVTAIALAVALPRVRSAELPRVAVTSSAFFVVSLISVPIGVTSVHLVLSALMGLVLGSAIVPAVLVGLILQAVFFGFGGIATLGVTTMNIALPGLLWASAFRHPIASAKRPLTRGLLAALAATLSIATSAMLVVGVLGLSEASYFASAPLVLLSYVPLAIGEALVTGFAVVFLTRVMPQALRSLQASGVA